MSIENSNDTIGNRIRGLPACSAVPRPTARLHVRTKHGLAVDKRRLYWHKRPSLFWAITQRLVVFHYWRFGTTYRSHLQGSRNHPLLAA